MDYEVFAAASVVVCFPFWIFSKKTEESSTKRKINDCNLQQSSETQNNCLQLQQHYQQKLQNDCSFKFFGAIFVGLLFVLYFILFIYRNKKSKSEFHLIQISFIYILFSFSLFSVFGILFIRNAYLLVLSGVDMATLWKITNTKNEWLDGN